MKYCSIIIQYALLQLVYAGKVLREDSMDIESIVGSGREIGTVTMHIVVRETRQQACIDELDQQVIDHSRIKDKCGIETNNTGACSTEAVISSEVEMEAEEAGKECDHAGRPGSGLGCHGTEESRAKNTQASNLKSDASSFRSQDDVYQSIFNAAYQAAVQALVSCKQVEKSEGSETKRQSGSNINAYLNLENASTLAFLPTVIPLPQPAFPSAIRNHPSEGHAEGQCRFVASHDEQQGKPLLVPVVTFPIPTCSKQYESTYSWKTGPRRQRNYGQAETSEHVLRLLRELRGQQEQSDRTETENINELQPNDQGRNNARRQQVQIRIHINMRVLLQVAVLLLIVYQHCPPGRFLSLLFIGIIFYLSSTRIGKLILQRVMERFHAHRMENGHQRADGQANNHVHDRDDGHLHRDPVPPAPREHDGQNIARPPPGAGLLQEIQAFLAGFITSLLPAAAGNGALQGNNDDMQMREVFGANNGNGG